LKCVTKCGRPLIGHMTANLYRITVFTETLDRETAHGYDRDRPSRIPCPRGVRPSEAFHAG